MRYAYSCPSHGPFEVPIPADSCLCPDCGDPSRRLWAVHLDRRSARVQGHWNPQVGRYVANQREFNEALKEGAARQEAELNMECRLAQVDSRDQAGMAETHGHSLEHRLETAEATERAIHDERVKANHESVFVP